MIKTCEHCGKEFDGHGNAKYCVDCRSKAQLERTHRYRENHRKQRPKPVAKPVEKTRPLSEKFAKSLQTMTVAKINRRPSILSSELERQTTSTTLRIRKIFPYRWF